MKTLRKAIIPGITFVLLLTGVFLGAAQTPAPTECPVVEEWGSPAAIRVVPVSKGLRISWLPSPQAPSRLEGFQIVRSQALSGNYREIAIVHETVTEIVDESAVPGEIYYYRIRGLLDRKCTPFSDPARGLR